MGKSGNPAARAVSSASDFKKKRGGGLFELPSGLYMKLRNPGGMAVLLKEGMIPNSLLAVANKSLEGKRSGPEDFKAEDGKLNLEMVNDMMQLMDHIIVVCAVEPRVYPAPGVEDERSDDLLYADEIEDEDKMFVFQWLTGGTADLESFRQRYSSNLDALGGGAALELPSI